MVDAFSSFISTTMKTRFLSFLLLTFCALNAMGATVKAILCTSNKTLYFVYDNNSYTVGQNFNADDGSSPMVSQFFEIKYYYVTYNAYSPAQWKQLSSYIEKVNFQVSFRDCPRSDYGYWFKDMTDLTTVENCSNLSAAFARSSSRVTMNSMFSGCTKLTLDGFSSLNVENVRGMGALFKDCTSITDLTPLQDWNVGNVETMSSIFNGCTGISDLTPLKDWDVSNVTTLSFAFNGLAGITDLTPLKDWNVSNLSELDCTFYNCTGITDLTPIKDWNASNVTTLHNTFKGCTNLTLAPLSNWNISSNLTDLTNTFEDCSSLTSLDMIGWDVSGVTTMSRTFYNCSSLTNLDLSGWRTSSSLTSLFETFTNCESLKSIDLNGFNTINVTDMRHLFQNCINFTKFKIGDNFSVSNLADATKSDNSDSGDQGMFGSCWKLRYIDYYDCYTGSTPNTVVPLSSNTGKKPTFDKMFSYSPATKVIYLPKGSTAYTNKQNVVYSSGETLRCPSYFSEEKSTVHPYYNEIELPYSFQTNRAEYSRKMPSGSKYGTIILPYDFTSNSSIQCYVLNQEHPGKMYFVEATTVPAHTPFLFEKKSSGTTASFVMEDATGNFGITVHATRDTSVPVPAEIPDGMTADDYGPYKGSYTITAQPTTGSAPIAENLFWETRGYYETTVLDEDENMFYIAQNKFWQAKNMQSADGKLTVYPHRATYHGNWTYAFEEPSGARFFDIGILDMDDEDVVTSLIEVGRQYQAEYEATAIYDTMGRQQQHLGKGLNIIRKSDGSIRKYIKK